MLAIIIIIVAIIVSYLAYRYWGSLFAAVAAFLICVLVLPMVADQLNLLKSDSGSTATFQSSTSCNCQTT